MHGVFTRAVDQLAEALGLKGISRDQVSRICNELDGQVTAFRTRRLDAEYPHLMLDATFEKVQENGRVISMAVLIALAVKRTGEREVVGVDVGPGEDFEFWRSFLCQLVARGLKGVRLVTSDAHDGRRPASAGARAGDKTEGRILELGLRWSWLRRSVADSRSRPTGSGGFSNGTA